MLLTAYWNSQFYFFKYFADYSWINHLKQSPHFFSFEEKEIEYIISMYFFFGSGIDF